jgi:hypothetical protein
VRDSLRWPSLICATGVAVAALEIADVDSPIRVVVTLLFMFVCTGMAFVPLLGVRPLVVELGLGVTVSIVLDTLVATMLVVVSGLSATSGLIALGALCLIGCGLQVLLLPQWTDRRAGRGAQDPAGGNGIRDPAARASASSRA